MTDKFYETRKCTVCKKEFTIRDTALNRTCCHQHALIHRAKATKKYVQEYQKNPVNIARAKRRRDIQAVKRRTRLKELKYNRRDDIKAKRKKHRDLPEVKAARSEYQSEYLKRDYVIAKRKERHNKPK